MFFFFFFFNDTATTEIYTLSLHDALPISFFRPFSAIFRCNMGNDCADGSKAMTRPVSPTILLATRSEEHTSELQSRLHLVCRLLLEKKKKTREKVYARTLQLIMATSTHVR